MISSIADYEPPVLFKLSLLNSRQSLDTLLKVVNTFQEGSFSPLFTENIKTTLDMLNKVEEELRKYEIKGEE